MPPLKDTPTDLLQHYRTINGIEVPIDRWDCGPIPAGCKGIPQEWTHVESRWCITEDESEIRVFPETFCHEADTRSPAELNDDGFYDAWLSIERGIEMSELVQSTEPRTHPNLQQYYGIDTHAGNLRRSRYKGFPRYEAMMGSLFLFLVMDHGIEIAESVRYQWAWQLLSALKFLHDKGFIHNRIGERKLWLKHDLSLVLCDLCSITRSDKEQPGEGHGYGEQDDNCYIYFKRSTTGYPQLDIYAFGAMFYFMLIGVDPSENHINPMRDKPQLLPNISCPNTREILRKSWNLEYKDITTIMQDLRAAMQGKGMDFDDSGNPINSDSNISELISKFQSSL